MNTSGNEETPVFPSSAQDTSRSTRVTAIASLFWIPLSFLIPYMCVSYMPPHEVNTFVGVTRTVSPEALRSGVLGTIVAFLVFFLWKIDCYAHPQARQTVREIVCLSVCAIALWVAWTFSGNIMLRTHEEVNRRGHLMQ